ncbi:nitroreductase family protein [Corynebacterium frankenforstense]
MTRPEEPTTEKTGELTEPDAAELLAARYGAGHVPQTTPAPLTETIANQLRHRSVRRWLDRDVDEPTLTAVLSAAQSAATSSNKQTVSVVTVRDAATKQGLAEAARQMAGHIAHAPVVLVWLVDHSRARLLAARAAAGGEAPDLGGLGYLEEVLASVTDVGIAAQAAVDAAESLGLGTVYLGSLRNDVARVRELVGAPRDVVPVLGLAIGHPDPEEKAGTKPRLPLELFAHRDRYVDCRSDPEAAAALAAYDETLAGYYSRYGSHSAWSDQLLGRLSEEAATKTTRHLLREEFNRSGYGLR